MATDMTKNKVLVVEDDEAMLKALRSSLVEAGLTVIEAKNGMSGLMVALKELPDIILLDILMPMMDGWEMLKELRGKNDWGKCVPVVILTNLSADEDVQIRNIAELGPSFFMVKSDWKLEGIADKVLEILNAPKVPCP
ncbi:MAG: response regulator [Candidatus Pacebacteria bacterium]|nr:response regulator [Candidatus Paceibacterota bacterium]